MNLPNKITMVRIFLTLVVIFILVFPFYLIGINVPTLILSRNDINIAIDIRFLIAGVIFVIAAITDYLDGFLARKMNLVTDQGKVMDAIADKILVNSTLIILTAYGFIGPVIPVLVIGRDAVVDILKNLAGNKGHVIAASKMGQIKTVVMLVAIALILFYNLPFALFNINVAMFLLVFATGLSIVSGIEYYYNLKKFIFPKTEK